MTGRDTGGISWQYRVCDVNTMTV